MKKIIFLPILFICIFTNCKSTSNRAEQIRKELLNPSSEKVHVVAHRGFWYSGAPENSIAGIDSAISIKADITEFDVWKTKDGQLVIMHDENVERTTNGKGKISDLTLNEIKQLKLKNYKGEITNQSIPTLEEALIHARGRIMVVLDKAYEYFDEIYYILEKTKTTRYTIIKSGYPADSILKHHKDKLNELIYMPLIGLDFNNAETLINDYIKKIHPAIFEFNYSNAGNPLPIKIKKTLKNKSLTWYSTLWPTLAGGITDNNALKEPEKNYGHLIDSIGANIIQTDRPDYLVNYLRQRGLHE